MKYHVRLNDGKPSHEGGKDVAGGAWFTNHRGERTYIMLVTLAPGAGHWENGSVVVWYDTNGDAYCQACTGILVAMSSSCRHVQAVKRAVKAGRVTLP